MNSTIPAEEILESIGPIPPEPLSLYNCTVICSVTGFPLNVSCTLKIPVNSPSSDVVIDCMKTVCSPARRTFEFIFWNAELSKPAIRPLHPLGSTISSLPVSTVIVLGAETAVFVQENCTVTASVIGWLYSSFKSTVMWFSCEGD